MQETGGGHTHVELPHKAAKLIVLVEPRQHNLGKLRIVCDNERQSVLEPSTKEV